MPTFLALFEKTRKSSGILIRSGYTYLNRHTGDKKSVMIKPAQKAKINVISERRNIKADDKQREKRKRYVPDFKRRDIIGIFDQDSFAMLFLNFSFIFGNRLCR